MQEAVVGFYGVEKCGYYARGDELSEFGSLSSTLNGLREWALGEGQTLAETCTFGEILENDSLRVFCFDMAVNALGDVVLVTWNESETANGSFASVNGAQPVGQADVATEDVPAGHIAGFPTYFWFLPDRNEFATIKLGNRLIGHDGLKRYIMGFLSYCSANAVFVEEEHDNELEFLGYRENADSPLRNNVRPQFKTFRKRTAGPLGFIRANREKITKVIKKTTIDTDTANDRGFLERLLRLVGYEESTDGRDGLRIAAELPIQPTEEELEEIISIWEEDFQECGGVGWTDVGFKLKGDQKVWWLSTALVTTEVVMDITPNAAGVFPADGIAESLVGLRERLLRNLG